MIRIFYHDHSRSESDSTHRVDDILFGWSGGTARSRHSWPTHRVPSRYAERSLPRRAGDSPSSGEDRGWIPGGSLYRQYSLRRRLVKS